MERISGTFCAGDVIEGFWFAVYLMAPSWTCADAFPVDGMIEACLANESWEAAGLLRGRFCGNGKPVEAMDAWGRERGGDLIVVKVGGMMKLLFRAVILVVEVVG
jgi:hypothetical protein